MIRIKYNEKELQAEEGKKIVDIFSMEIEQSEKGIIACRYNNEIKSLAHVPKEDGEIEFIGISNKDGMRIYTRGILFVMAMAFEEIYHKPLITINYQLSDGMFCEVENIEITDEIIANVNERMKEIIERDLPIKRVDMTVQEAEEFYKKHNTLKGRLQLDIKERNRVLLYYCQSYFNYFYGVMPISTGYMKVYEVLRYHNGFLVRYPNKKEIDRLQPMADVTKLMETLNEYKSLHKILDINTIYKLNREIEANKIKDDILLDEALHEKKIACIADEILERKGVKVILIAGPSSSGKTTFAERLGIQLKINGIKPVTLSVDNYFVERENNPKDAEGKYNFEVIEAIDLDLFNDHLVRLLNGEEISVPTFDFTKGTKEYKGNTMKLEQDEVLVIEGIHCLNDRLTINIPREQKYKIYISCLTVLNIDYFNRISTTDTRLIRRIVRDNQFRGYTALHTLEMWDSVTRGEVKNIFPFQEEADSMFNSSLIYELAVLKDYALPLLQEIDNSHSEYSEAKKLVEFLKYFKSIPEKVVPSHSLLREFIGGSIFEEKIEEIGEPDEKVH